VTLKSGLEVTQDHWNWYHLKAWVRRCGFLFAFRSNCGAILYHLRDIVQQAPPHSCSNCLPTPSLTYCLATHSWSL